MICRAVIYHRNNVKLFKTLQWNHSIYYSFWFHVSFEYFDVMENCSPFFKTQEDPRAAITLTYISFKVSPKIARVMIEWNWQIASPSPYFHGLCSHLPYHSSRPIRRREIVSEKDHAIFKTSGGGSVVNGFKNSGTGVFHFYIVLPNNKFPFFYCVVWKMTTKSSERERLVK